jgi:hypothetical protein
MGFTSTGNRNGAGAALPVVLLLLLGIALLTLSTGRVSGIQEKLAGNAKRIQEALLAAETGLQSTIDVVMAGTAVDNDPANPNWATTFTVTGFDTTVTLRHMHRDGLVVMAPNTNNKPVYVMTATGHSGPEGRRAKRELEAAVYFTHSDDALWDYALAGCEGVDFAGNSHSDSYSSSNPGAAAGNMGDIGTLNPNADIQIDTNSSIEGDIRATGNLTLENNAKACRTSEAGGTITLIGSAWTASDVNAEGDITLTDNQDTDCDGNAIAQSVGGDVNGFGNITIAGDGAIIGTATATGTVTLGAGSAGADFPGTVPPIDIPVVPAEACDPLDIDAVMAARKLDICDNGNNNNGELIPAFFTSATGVYDMDLSSGTDTIGAVGAAKAFCLSQFVMSKSGKVTIQGDVTLYIQDGSADFPFSLESNDDLVLAADSSLHIFVDHDESGANPYNGRVYISSNANVNYDRVADTAGIPSNIRLFADYPSSIPACGNVGSPPKYDGLDLAANTEMRAVIYAPRSCLAVGTNGGDFYGAMRGGYVEMASNASFHYDEDLGEVGSGLTDAWDITGWHLLYWKEN